MSEMYKSMLEDVNMKEEIDQLKRELKEANHRREKAEQNIHAETKEKFANYAQVLKLRNENSALKELVREFAKCYASDYETYLSLKEKARALIGGDE